MALLRRKSLPARGRPHAVLPPEALSAAWHAQGRALLSQYGVQLRQGRGEGSTWRVRDGRVRRAAGGARELGDAAFAGRAAAHGLRARAALAPGLAVPRRGDVGPRRGLRGDALHGDFGEFWRAARLSASRTAAAWRGSTTGKSCFRNTPEYTARRLPCLEPRNPPDPAWLLPRKLRLTLPHQPLAALQETPEGGIRDRWRAHVSAPASPWGRGCGESVFGMQSAGPV